MPSRNLAPPGLRTAQEELHRHRYYGDYAGFVRDVDDPEKRGRVRVWVPSLLGDEDVPQGWLDWCEPGGEGGLNVPPVGANVWVTFEQGLVDHGVYRYGWFSGNSPANSAAPKASNWHLAKPAATKGFGPEVRANIPADPATIRAPKYPSNKVLKTPEGHEIELDDTGLEVVGGVLTGRRARYRHPSGTTILVDGEGSVYVLSAGAQYHQAGGDYVVQLGRGASFKVVYPDGSGMIIGPSGTHIVGDQATVLGRSVIPTGEDILWRRKTPQTSAKSRVPRAWGPRSASGYRGASRSCPRVCPCR